MLPIEEWFRKPINRTEKKVNVNARSHAAAVHEVKPSAVKTAKPIETKEPYTIGIYELDYIALELAEAEVKKALQIIADMDELDNIVNVYGSQSIEPVMLALPNYVFYDSEA